MRIGRKRRTLCCLAAALILTTVWAFADSGVQVEDRGLDLTEEVSVHYPALTGMEDAELLERINEQIQQDCGIREYLARASQMISGGRLRTEWTGGLIGEDVFSCIVSAEGALETARMTHALNGSNIDLRDGHEITFAELFTDEAAAGELLGNYLEYDVAPELSAHLQNSEVTPIPEAFALEPSGLRLLYPVEQLSTLGDRAGDIRVGWHVLREVLNLEEDSILKRIGADEMITLSPESCEKLRSVAEAGTLPGIPAGLGDSMQELTDKYHMLTDPDGYEGGRMFALEGGSFRGVYLLTDDLDRKWENSVVQGIRADQGCVYGLCVGETRRDEWLAALGEPDSSAEITAEKAEANRIRPGNCDYYTMGEKQLQLYSDDEGVLISLMLVQ